MSRPRLVCVTPYLPSAQARHAGGLLLHRRLAGLAPAVDVGVVAPQQEQQEQQQDAADLLLLPPAPVLPGWAGTAAGLLRAAAGRLDALVPRVAGALASDPRARALLRSADVVEVHWGEYLPLVPVLRRLAPQARLGVLLHDVVSEAKRGRAANRLVWAPERFALALGARPLARQELRLLQACDVVFVLKDQDREALRARGLRSTVEVARPGLDLPEPVPGPAAEPVALFVAALWREENAAAAQWLVSEVWPRVRAQVPGARLRLVGDRPPAGLVPVPALGVEVPGYVEDLGAEHRAARVALAPLTTATGLKVKVPQAMAFGLPVVARPAAAQGVRDAPPEALGGVADDPASYARLVVQQLVGPGTAERTGAAAAAWVRACFDPAADARATLAAYAAAGADLRTPREP